MTKYQELALNTFQRKEFVSENILHCKAGIIGEFGEIVDCYKKKIYTPSRFKDNVAEEWADGYWYIAVWASLLDLKLSPIREYDLRLTDDAILEMLITDAPGLSECVTRGKFLEVENTWHIIASYTRIDTAAALEANIKKLEARWNGK